MHYLPRLTLNYQQQDLLAPHDKSHLKSALSRMIPITTFDTVTMQTISIRTK